MGVEIKYQATGVNLMHSIRMVSNEEGEKLRAEEAARQDEIKNILIGSKITGLTFHGIGITGHTIQELSLEKDGQRWVVQVEAEQFYECITSRLVITNEGTGAELK
jgi:hypothetical protein